ncbi:MAG: response regulator [Deltaproteobacteria bacterium]|nr:response regulator [Deltaproteobacteria bacterium]
MSSSWPSTSRRAPRRIAAPPPPPRPPPRRRRRRRRRRRAAAAAAAAAPPAEGLTESVRVAIGDMDELLDGVFEASVRLSAMAGDLGALERAKHVASVLEDHVSRGRGHGADVAGGARVRSLVEELAQTLERVHRVMGAGLEQALVELGQVRDAAERLRLVPARAVFTALERAARDAARALGKDVVFSATGGEQRLDAHVLAALRDALLHVVRNAVVHGVEAPAARRAADKPAAGRVTLDVERRGARVVFTCRDDGRGVDLAAVRRVAAGRGLVADPDELDHDAAVGLLLRGGVSTAAATTELAGRGIGLDVLRETVARLRGELDIRSESGRGTVVTVTVPVSLSSLPGLVVEAGGVTVTLPLAAVRETLRAATQDIATHGDGASVTWGGHAVPYAPLAALVAPAEVAAPVRALVVVGGLSDGVAALGVTRLVGTVDVVVRPLPAVVEAAPIIAGASLDAQGDPQLVLDPEALVRAVARLGPRPLAASPARPLPILVVDDSLTTRMLEQSVLTSAGYDVDLATCGEEGLEMLRARRYGLALVDVEMPGIDGFEVVAQVRADPDLRAIPVILVTSRAADEDLRRGREAGADDYIVKGEFDQERLLRRIRELMR